MSDDVADAKHLLELWDMLPGWSHKTFWSDLAAAQGRGGEGRHYFDEKMNTIPVMLRQYLENDGEGDSFSLPYLAQYVLMFFDCENQAMFEVLDEVTGYTAEAGRSGRRWAADATATAWRLYVPGQAHTMRGIRDPADDQPPWKLIEDD
ncbi:hypothetical protein [Pseudonocardia sp. T1-2H]|uniref:hypothetical protein n=1 Tax=Pseudonocardia sp. T1-2H TaxID=3128899 RepID=UPI003100C15D